MFGVTAATFATPASAFIGPSADCTQPCRFNFGHPEAVTNGSAEVGLQFQTDIDGWIAGICFWAAPTETGTHKVTLWDPDGNVVASASSVLPDLGGTESCVDFNPLPQITANTTYTASYTSAVAYDVQPGFFEANFAQGHLHSGINAGTIGPAGSFPHADPSENAYGVDIAFLGNLAGITGDCVSTLTAPTSPSAAPGTNFAVVSWGPATSDPAGCIAGYVVTPFLNGTTQMPSTLIPGLGTTTQIRGLTSGQSYTFTISAESGRTIGPASDPTPAVTVGTPTAPQAMKVTRLGNGSVKVAFKAPKRNNGAAITKYTATCTSSGRGTRSKAGKASPLKVTGLAKGKAYHCTVRATNRRGNGQAARSVTVKG